ncbi:MAG: SpoIVB peptidase [Ruminococcus sp.]|nr:SpoIVB peptidase [Ruminococcus sp.]
MAKNVSKKNLKLISVVLVFIFFLFSGLIPAEAKTKQVIIGGESFGLKLYCKGVMVTRLESFEGKYGDICPAQKAGVKKGDIITSINNKKVKSNEEVNDIIKNSEGKKLRLSILRNEGKLNIDITPEQNSQGEYFAGIWVRDSCAGIGTISYYDADSMTYGALGHGICDVDTGCLMATNSGEILSASISSVTKSENNNIGTLNGYFTDDSIGTIADNTALGIHGKLNTCPQSRIICDVTENSELKTGNAYMYTTIDGTKPKKYEVEIESICNYNENTNRNFIIKVTDKRLLKKTGGIVQGMSGSPIIQNGKFVGALTHVFLENCTEGYGILAENIISD